MTVIVWPVEPHQCAGPDCAICERAIRQQLGLCPFCTAPASMIEQDPDGTRRCLVCSKEWRTA